MNFRPRQSGRIRIRDRLLVCATLVNVAGGGLLDCIRKNFVLLVTGSACNPLHWGSSTEFGQLSDDPASGRVRRPGAGRKKVEPESPEEINLRACLDVRTAGDPDDQAIVYTSLSPKELSDKLTEIGTPVGRDAVATWLDDARIIEEILLRSLRFFVAITI